MNKRDLKIEKYTSILELNDIDLEIYKVKRHLEKLKNRRKYLRDRIMDINYYCNHFNQIKPLLEPKYK